MRRHLEQFLEHSKYLAKITFLTLNRPWNAELTCNPPISETENKILSKARPFCTGSQLKKLKELCSFLVVCRAHVRYNLLIQILSRPTMTEQS